MTADVQRIALAAFLAEAVLAGGNGVGIRISLRELADSPMWSATMRFALAGALMLAVMAVLRLPLPRGRALAGAAIYGLVTFGGSFSLAYYALLQLHAGFGQIILGLTPLATLLLAVGQRQEHLRYAAVVGALISFVGIAAMSQEKLRADVEWPYLLAALGSVLCFAQGTILARRFPRVHPITTNAVGMIVAAVFLFVLSLGFSESLIIPERGATWAAIGYLVVFGSAAVFALYVLVLRYWEASRAAYSFVLIPIVTVIISAWLDNEPLTLSLLGGGVLVLLGVYIGALRPAKTRAALDASTH